MRDGVHHGLDVLPVGRDHGLLRLPFGGLGVFLPLRIGEGAEAGAAEGAQQRAPGAERHAHGGAGETALDGPAGDGRARRLAGVHGVPDIHAHAGDVAGDADELAGVDPADAVGDAVEAAGKLLRVAAGLAQGVRHGVAEVLRGVGRVLGGVADIGDGVRRAPGGTGGLVQPRRRLARGIACGLAG